MKIAAILSLSLVIVAATGAASSPPAPEQPDIAGYWVTAERDSIIQIGRCGSTVCGIVRSFVGKPDDTDRANPNPSNRTQPICGLRIIGGLASAGPGWSKGWIYDPETGSRYGLSVKSVSSQKLKLRAFQGFEALGENLVWTRSAKVPKSCSDV